MTVDFETREASVARPDALEPVRVALLEAARRDAADVRARAAANADAVIYEARQRAGAILADAAYRGTAEGTAMAAVATTRARRRARESVLRAQREAYEELRRRSRDAVRALRDAPDYVSIRYRLRRLAQAQAGVGATTDDQADGGLAVEAADRRVDCSLETMADRALDALGAEVEELWTE